MSAFVRVQFELPTPILRLHWLAIVLMVGMLLVWQVIYSVYFRPLILEWSVITFKHHILSNVPRTGPLAHSVSFDHVGDKFRINTARIFNDRKINLVRASIGIPIAYPKATVLSGKNRAQHQRWVRCFYGRGPLWESAAESPERGRQGEWRMRACISQGQVLKRARCDIESRVLLTGLKY